MRTVVPDRPLVARDGAGHAQRGVSVVVPGFQPKVHKLAQGIAPEPFTARRGRHLQRARLRT